MRLAHRIGSAWLMACAAIAGPAAAQTPAWQAPITLQGAGPFHRLSLPAAVYSRAGFDDLRDLRVRNASGQPVPYAWLDGDAEAVAPPVTSTRAPLFAVPAPAAGASTDAPLIGLRLRTDGSLALAATSTQAASAKATATEWVIDASKVVGALVQARFELAPGALGLFAITLEASDDLRRWQRIGTEEQLVRLQQAGQTIERLALELDHVHAKFLRLRWRDPSRAPALTGVLLDSVAETEPVAALEWSADVQPTTCTAEHCDYAVPRGWPVQSLRVTLADANTLAPLQISSLRAAGVTARPPRNALYVLRHGRDHTRGAGAQELLLADTVVYRLNPPGGEARSAPVPLDGATHTTLRLRSHGAIAALGSSPPALSFGARPRTLVFLAQGTPPFVLSGNAPGQALARDVPGPLPLATLVPGYRVGQALPADLASVVLPALQPPAAPIASAPSPEASTSTRKRWLWAALGGGLLLLAAMTWSLLRGLKNAPTEPG